MRIWVFGAAAAQRLLTGLAGISLWGRGDGGRLSDAVNRYRIADQGQAGGEPRRAPSSWARSGVVIGSSSTILPSARR